MFNKQLKVNIKQLDLQISKLSEELEDVEKDSKYEITMEKLETLTKLRTQLAQSLKEKETSDAILEMDKQIEELTKIVENLGRDDVYTSKMAKLDELIKMRGQLTESKVKSSHTSLLVSSGVSIASVLLVLHYEKAEVVTSKAFSMATKMFRGN